MLLLLRPAISIWKEKAKAKGSLGHKTLGQHVQHKTPRLKQVTLRFQDNNTSAHAMIMDIGWGIN